MYQTENCKNISSEMQRMCCEWTIAFLQCLVGKQGLCVLQMSNCSSSISSALSFITGWWNKDSVSEVLIDIFSNKMKLLFVSSRSPELTSCNSKGYILFTRIFTYYCKLTHFRVHWLSWTTWDKNQWWL